MRTTIASLKQGSIMNTLTKEQVQKLPPEAQEALGLQLMERTKRRDHLLKTVRQCNDQGWFERVTALVWALLLIGITFSLMWGGPPYSWPMIASFSGLVGIVCVVDFTNPVRAIRIDRRLDALIELLETNGQLSEPGIDPGTTSPKPATTAAQG